MDKSQAIQTLKKVKENSQKRNFTQSIDLIINLRDIDIKKTDQQVNFFHTLHYPKGRKVKICALVGPELLSQAKEVCDLAVSIDDFPKYQKKEAKRLATEYDFFIAQATIMPKVAQTFGKVFGPKGKMPNPKAGCVVPPNANIKPLYEKLQKTVKLQTKNDAIIQTIVGNEEMKDEEVVDNIMTTYDDLVHHLPSGKNNVKNVLLKLTMGKSFQIGKEEAVDETETKKPKKEKGKAEKPKEEAKAEEKKLSNESEKGLEKPKAFQKEESPKEEPESKDKK